MISNTIKTIGAACTVAAAIAVVVVPTASAKGRDGMRVAGVCDNGSTSKLKVKRDDGRLKVEFEVDQNVTGVAWDVDVTRNGKIVLQGVRTTKAPSGSFSFERRVKRATGGKIVATATRNGEVCTASITVPAKSAVAVTSPANDQIVTTVHDANDDNGNDPAGHDAGDDHGNQGSGSSHDGNDDDHGHHGSDD